MPVEKSLYGLKQSPKCWYDALSVYLKELNFQQSVADPCMFYKGNDLTLLTVYVDDLILMVDVYEKLIKLKGELSSRFKMTDMGKLSYCLGICVVQRERSLQIHQKPYLVKVIRRFGMEDASTIGTPSDPHVQLSVAPGTSQPADKHKYLQIVGSLQYAASGTRPDIAFSVNAAAKYCSGPLQLHMTAVKRILPYLSKTIDYGIEYTRSDGKLEGYSDANWAGDHADRRPISGYVFQLANGAITWASRKQNSVALSTCEAEYMALSVTTQEVIWLRRLLEEMRCEQKEPTTIWEDNQGSISTAKNPVFHNRTKHIQIRNHFVREAVADNIIDIRYCSTRNMIADILTKGIARPQFEKLREMMGVKLIQ